MDVIAVVREDALLRVRETITVLAEGNEIRRGIIRVFPTDYTDFRRRTIRTGFALLSATMDGRPTGAQTSRVGGNIEIQLGNPDRYLSPGIHIFEIVYEATGWIAFRDDYDELYWNVTGNDWIFPIDRATFHVELPGNEPIMKYEAFTGRYGETGGNFISAPDGTFKTTGPLSPGEGLTVAVAWRKGIIAPPPVSFWENLPYLIHDYRLPLTLLFLAIVFIYYFTVWYLKGRDPAKGTIIPRFYPPEGVEPGFARYLQKMRYSQEAMVADILELAVKGYLYFKEESGITQIVPTAKIVGEGVENQLPELSESLRSLAQTLFVGAGKVGIPVNETAGAVFNRAGEQLKNTYEWRGQRYFNLNRGYSVTGFLLFIPWIFAVVLASGLHMDLGAIVGPFMILLILGMRRFNRSKLLVAGALIGILALWGVFLFDPIVFGGFVIAALIALVFSRIMPVRTPEGARIAAEIEGLSMYMRTAERHRMEMLNPPAETPELFERLLPYAFALDCAETWANHFADVLEKASYQPEWDQFGDDGRYGWENMATRYILLSNMLSRDVSSSIAGYNTARAIKSSPPSTTYRGGGGFGGGGGGGGGRGW